MSALLIALVANEAPAFTVWRSWASAPRPSPTARNAGESFDPFGIKEALKSTMSGLAGEEQPDERPSELNEQMMVEIFTKYDLDADGILNINEFNALQKATEGDDAVYTGDQLKDLLYAVNSGLQDADRGMPFQEYRRLYVSRKLKSTYNTDVERDHIRIFGPGGGDAAVRAEARTAAGLTEGVAVTVEGLVSAQELNGKGGHIVAPIGSEVGMIAEGRVVVCMADDEERVALKLANVKATMQLAD